MKIGILTMELGQNYGGIMQNFAMQKVLRKAGHAPITLDYYSSLPLKIKVFSLCKRIMLKLIGQNVPMRGWETQSEKNSICQNTRQFMKMNLMLSKRFDIKKLNSNLFPNLEAILVGSDQVWRGGNNYISKYYLDGFDSFSYHKFAYAVSLGVSRWPLSEKETIICSALAKEFKFISAREKSAQELLKEHLGVDVYQVLDPTLLLEKEEYDCLLANESGTYHNASGVFAYILDSTIQKDNLITTISSELNHQVYEIMPRAKFQEIGKKGINQLILPQVEDWLRCFHNADFVVTDSYHGMIFSIIYKKNFAVIVNKKRGADRFYSVLDILCLRERVINNIDAAKSVCAKPIDYSTVSKILRKQIDYSQGLLNSFFKESN